MNKLSLKATGLAAMIAWEFLTVLMLLHQWLLGASEVGAWQILFLRALYPGFQTLNAIGILIALVQGAIWPWIFAGIFVWIYNRVISKQSV